MNSLMIKTLAVSVSLAATMAFQARADLEDLGDHPQGGNSNPDTELGLIEALSGEDLTFLYRYPTGEGTFDSYFTVSDNLDGTADVSWNLTGSGAEAWALGVKSGDDDIHWYGVHANERLISDPHPVSAPGGITSISHISFFGKLTGPGPDPDPVPDTGSTALLLGAALLGLQGYRRMIAR
jgi:hypothetical protein